MDLHFRNDRLRITNSAAPQMVYVMAKHRLTIQALWPDERLRYSPCHECWWGLVPRSAVWHVLCKLEL